MNDTKKRKHKLKGKICAPAAATTAEVKSTKHWCKGKNGLEHLPEMRYDARPDRNWGLATHAEERCSRCNKVLRSSYQLPEVEHDFADIVKAIRFARGLDALPDSVLAEAARSVNKAVALIRALTCEVSNVEFSIEFRPKEKTGQSWLRRAVRLATKAK